MNFSDAIDHLKSGEKITRKSWDNKIWFEMSADELLSCQEHFELYQYDESIMISDGWSLLNSETEEEHSFSEIMDYLIRGFKAKLKEWQDMYIYFCPTDRQLILSRHAYNCYTPIIDDFIAQDWIIKE